MMVPVAILAVLATVGGFIETRALGFGPTTVSDFLSSVVGQPRWEGGGAEIAVTFLTMILATALFVGALLPPSLVESGAVGTALAGTQVLLRRDL